MADTGNSTPNFIDETLDISLAALAAWRAGLAKLVEHLATVIEGENGEANFDRACVESYRHDMRILGMTPKSIADLKIQATIVTENDGDDLPETVLALLSAISEMEL